MSCDATDCTRGSPLLGPPERAEARAAPTRTHHSGSSQEPCPGPTMEPQQLEAHVPSTPSLPPSSQPHPQDPRLDVSPHGLLPSLSKGTRGGDPPVPLCFSKRLSSGPGPCRRGKTQTESGEVSEPLCGPQPAAWGLCSLIRKPTTTTRSPCCLPAAAYQAGSTVSSSPRPPKAGTVFLPHFLSGGTETERLSTWPNVTQL